MPPDPFSVDDSADRGRRGGYCGTVYDTGRKLSGTVLSCTVRVHICMALLCDHAGFLLVRQVGLAGNFPPVWSPFNACTVKSR